MSKQNNLDGGNNIVKIYSNMKTITIHNKKNLFISFLAFQIMNKM